jgi:hypothetical protein
MFNIHICFQNKNSTNQGRQRWKRRLLLGGLNPKLRHLRIDSWSNHYSNVRPPDVSLRISIVMNGCTWACRNFRASLFLHAIRCFTRYGRKCSYLRKLDRTWWHSVDDPHTTSLEALRRRELDIKCTDGLIIRFALHVDHRPIETCESCLDLNDKKHEGLRLF